MNVELSNLVKDLRLCAQHATDDCDGAAYGCKIAMLQAADKLESQDLEIELLKSIQRYQAANTELMEELSSMDSNFQKLR